MSKRGARDTKWRDISSGWFAIPRHFSALQIVSHTHGLRYARSAMQMSQSQMGKAIARLTGRVRPIQQPTIANWEARRRPMRRECVDAVCRLLAAWLCQRLQRDDLGVKVRVNSPWHVTVWAQCKHHRVVRWYRLRSAKQFDCGRH